jgi:hypothetical protein
MNLDSIVNCQWLTSAIRLILAEQQSRGGRKAIHCFSDPFSVLMVMMIHVRLLSQSDHQFRQFHFPG